MKPKIKFKIPEAIFNQMKLDLQSPHKYASERVGFVYTKTVELSPLTFLVYCFGYSPVEDNNYIRSTTGLTKINSVSIRKEMQTILSNECGAIHVHTHNHNGPPKPSKIDQNGNVPEIIEGFVNIGKTQSHGIMILSNDSIFVELRIKGYKELIVPECIAIIGFPMRFMFKKNLTTNNPNSVIRQSFLGKDSNFLFENINVGIIGYGGAGSHIGQQLAHLGVKNITIFDDDLIDETNLNRLIGARQIDIKNKTPKVKIANRTISQIRSNSKITQIMGKWQDNVEFIKICDLVIAGVDSYKCRSEIESECRRHLIPLIDVGMDVHEIAKFENHISGQVIISMPGKSCMKCFGFLTEEKLGIEAIKYGNVGGRPQVVWSNGLLASTAIGLFVNLVTGWVRNTSQTSYYSYDGNEGTISSHIRMKFAQKDCTHYKLDDVGPVKFKPLN